MLCALPAVHLVLVLIHLVLCPVRGTHCPVRCTYCLLRVPCPVRGTSCPVPCPWYIVSCSVSVVHLVLSVVLRVLSPVRCTSCPVPCPWYTLSCPLYFVSFVRSVVILSCALPGVRLALCPARGQRDVRGCECWWIQARGGCNLLTPTVPKGKQRFPAHCLPPRATQQAQRHPVTGITTPSNRDNDIQ